jgi:hypothetical protein
MKIKRFADIGYILYSYFSNLTLYSEGKCSLNPSLSILLGLQFSVKEERQFSEEEGIMKI